MKSLIEFKNALNKIISKAFVVGFVGLIIVSLIIKIGEIFSPPSAFMEDVDDIEVYDDSYPQVR